MPLFRTLLPVSHMPLAFSILASTADALKSMDNKYAKRQRTFLMFKAAFYKAYVRRQPPPSAD